MDSEDPHLIANLPMYLLILLLIPSVTEQHCCLPFNFIFAIIIVKANHRGCSWGKR